MFDKAFHGVAGLTLIACLAACTHSTSQLATADDDRDGRNFAARPGMARLYVVQGLERYGDEPSDQIITGPSGSPQMVGAAVGVALAAVIKGARDKPDAPVMPPDPMDRDNKLKHVPIPLPSDIYVNDKKVGTVAHLQYVALDLPPADYVVKVTTGTSWQQPFGEKKISLREGQVAYFMNTELAYHGGQKNERSIVDCEPNDCKAFVDAGHRIAAAGK